ncbi:HTH-type transcriptional activator RhaS [Paenibacillus sp. CECT 9249]|nr:HTH-type transcriptional activator RhaS [Paenibacillus sp. CECT 9249]
MMSSTEAYTYSVASNPVYAADSEFQVLFAGESQTKPVHKLGPKVYDYFLLHVIESGAGVYTTEYESYRLGAGDSFLIEPEQLVSYMSDERTPWRYRWVAFKGKDAAGLARTVGFSTRNPVVLASDNRIVSEYIDHIRQSFRMNNVYSNLDAIGYLHLIMAAYGKIRKRDSYDFELESDVQKTVKQMIRYMSTQYAQPISIEKMAESLGYNRAYLSRIFKQATQMSPVTFLLKLRIDKGRQLLRERTELTVEQIAASVGFQDALYFSRQFRRFYQQSPTEYRNAMNRLSEDRR